jgi:hypothetical protein
MVSISAGVGGVESERDGGILPVSGIRRRRTLSWAPAARGTRDIIDGVSAFAINKTATTEVAGEVSRLLGGDVASRAAATAVEGDVSLEVFRAL